MNAKPFLFIVFVLSSLSFAATNKNSSLYYSIKLPDDWVEITSESISNNPEFKKSPIENFDFIYKPKVSESLYSYPIIFVKININRYQKTLPGRLASLADATIPSVDLNSIYKIDNKLYFEKETQWVWQRSDIGNNKRITIIIPTETGTINVSCFYEKPRFNISVPQIYNIVRSIKINEHKENRLPDVNKPGAHMFLAVFIAGFILVGSSTWGFLVLKKKSRLIYRVLISFCILLTIILVNGAIGKAIWSFFPHYEISTEILFLVLSVTVITYIGKGNFSDFGFNKVSFRTLLSAVLIAIVCTQLFSRAIGIFQLLLSSFAGIKFIPPKSEQSNSFIVALLLAGICEETLFRGLIQSYLSPLKEFRKTIFKIRISLPVLISAVLFGLIHVSWMAAGANLNFAILAFFTTGFAGLFLAYYREKTNSLIPSICIHTLMNTIAVISILYF